MQPQPRPRPPRAAGGVRERDAVRRRRGKGATTGAERHRQGATYPPPPPLRPPRPRSPRTRTLVRALVCRRPAALSAPTQAPRPATWRPRPPAGATSLAPSDRRGRGTPRGPAPDAGMATSLRNVAPPSAGTGPRPPPAAAPLCRRRVVPSRRQRHGHRVRRRRCASRSSSSYSGVGDGVRVSREGNWRGVSRRGRQVGGSRAVPMHWRQSEICRREALMGLEGESALVMVKISLVVKIIVLGSFACGQLTLTTFSS